MTGAPQESSVITTMATENKDQSATASLQPPAPSTGPAMSNTTPMTSTAAIILPPVGMGRVLFPELSLMLFHQLLSMTLAGLPPPLVCAFHGSPCYPHIYAEYKSVNFVLSDATMPVFRTITIRGGKLEKIRYLQIRSDNFSVRSWDARSNNGSRHPLKTHVCKLFNSFHEINFTAVQPARTQHFTNSELFEANLNIESILHEICHIVNASNQTPTFRVKFLGYNPGNLIDQGRLNQYVRLVTGKLADGNRTWTPRRELTGDGGVVHDGIVWIWEII
ncbi:hypothetical protein BCIN_09g03400 [Botrytis cinerea B05.10]|uniref:Uncharacterized protein n=1 Tax=Botryotinia fuckeliana (strain B05.10) TaxID=332648 RepID=A0A384JSE5_BOTFB|nr:hypothetical protein BCIN_09g03400 [Botrytis cinerea B05.10]ATZ53499.1 hypothetical protein BCIN_09g03400 [Botrytis cinerea B05.10]